MASPELKARMRALATKINEFTGQVVRLVNRKAESAGISDDSTALNNFQPVSMKTSVDNSISTHNNNVSNPHGVTPLILGGSSLTAFNALIATIVPQGVLPCSQFGDLKETSLPISTSGFILRIGAGVPFLCWGKSVAMPALAYTGAANKTYNVYANLVNGVGSYSVSETALAQNSTRVFIGKVTTGASGYTDLGIDRVSMIAGYRVSQDGIGAGIPVTAGDPTTTATLASNWKS